MNMFQISPAGRDKAQLAERRLENEYATWNRLLRDTLDMDELSQLSLTLKEDENTRERRSQK